ncbi:MAG: hypothetical protein RMM98_14100 [Acidobacteriota bacterium]|nr:hypothetical protein [Acidobacteriota bacterium]
MRKVGILTSLLMIALIGSFSISLRLKLRPQPVRVSGAYEALAAWNAQRSYPYAEMPGAAYYAAFEKAKKDLQGVRQAKFLSVAPWSAIGPHNIGGRTLAIAFDPQNPDTIYAGSASGGLWRSQTGGVGANAWQYVPTGFPVLAVSAIAFAPGDSRTFYIGTGEVYNYQNAMLFGQANRALRGSYGIGILKTTDGGATWSKSLDWSAHQQRGVQAVKVDPVNANVVWAATTEGVYKTTDAGRNWSRVLNVIMATDLVIHPMDTNIVIAACGNFASPGHGIYRTTDGGATWSKQTRGLPSRFAGKATLALCETSPNVVYAGIGNGFSSGSITWLCRSEDSGATWTIVSQVDYAAWQGWFSHDVAVNPTNPNDVITAGIQVWRSLTGGTSPVVKSTFNPFTGPVPAGAPEGPPNYVHSDIHDIVYHPRDPRRVYFATDGGVFRSLDGGETFQGCNGGYQTAQFYNGFSSSPTDPNLAIGGLQDNSTAIYRGHSAWSRFHIGGDGGWTAIDPRANHILYGSFQFLQIRKSVDNGQTWTAIAPASQDGRPTCFIAPYVLSPSWPDVLYAGRDIVYKSVDGGVSWTATNNGRPLDGNPILAMAISYQNSEVVYVASSPGQTRGRLFRTTDGGNSWTNITGNLPDRFPADLVVDPTNDAIVYVTFSGFGTSHVFKSTDGGLSWQDIGAGLPDVPTNALVVDPLWPDHLYVGNDLGVYVSTDGGRSWQNFSEGLLDAVAAFDLSISPSNRMLRVATHGNGVFERRLIGE